MTGTSSISDNIKYLIKIIPSNSDLDLPSKTSIVAMADSGDTNNYWIK